jgi:hypothetical protein
MSQGKLNRREIDQGLDEVWFKEQEQELAGEEPVTYPERPECLYEIKSLM